MWTSNLPPPTFDDRHGTFGGENELHVDRRCLTHTSQHSQLNFDQRVASDGDLREGVSMDGMEHEETSEKCSDEAMRFG